MSLGQSRSAATRALAAAPPVAFSGLAKLVRAQQATARAILARGARLYARGTTNGNALLGDPALYQRQIERLHSKYLFTPQLYEVRQDGVPFASIR